MEEPRVTTEAIGAREGPGNVVVEDGSDADASMEENRDGGLDGSADVGVGVSVEKFARKVFASEEEAYEMYKRFGKRNGFGIRKGDYCKDDAGNLIKRRFFCNKEGVRDPRNYERVDRKRAQKPETRTNCKAKLSIFLDRRAMVWRVRKIMNEHNHELTPRSMVHLIQNFRVLTDAAKLHVSGMYECGVPATKSVRYLAGLAGGYSLVGFLKKDVYNYLNKNQRERIMDGDANSALAYLEGKVDSDPMASARYNTTEEGMLANMVWADGGSRLNYQHFGDVLAFRRTNISVPL